MVRAGTVGTGDRGGGEALRRFARELGTEIPERRHEQLVEWAESELGLDRSYAVLAFELVRAGIGVRELEQPEQDMDEEASQQTPPDWVAEDAVELDDVALERRLRASFRRLRSHLESSDTPVEAVEAFLADADVGPQRMR